MASLEDRVREAFHAGIDLDLTTSADDDPVDGESWGTSRTVRAAVLADLLARPLNRTEHPRPLLWLIGAKIVGTLDLAYAEMAAPCVFDACWWEEPPNLNGTRAENLFLINCHLPGLSARLLTLRGDLDCSDSTVRGEVHIQDATIGGTFSLCGATLTNDGGDALNADGLTVDGAVVARDGFSAHGELRLLSAHINGSLDLSGATLTNTGGRALNADSLTVDGTLFARNLTTDGETCLLGAHLDAGLDLSGATLTNPAGVALTLGHAVVGTLWLMCAAPPIGAVRMAGLHVRNLYDHPDSWPGQLHLTGCTYDTLDARSLPGDNGPVAEEDGAAGTAHAPEPPSVVVPVSVRERLGWLRRDPDGFSPQPYEQLAACYRRGGHEASARRVLLEKERQRRRTLPLPAKALGLLIDGLVGYGYRNWLAALWLLGFWLLGTVSFAVHQPVPRVAGAVPAYHPAIHALDLILPIISFGQDEAWRPTGFTQYVAYLLIVAGWVLTTAVVAGLTRLLNRT